MIKPTRQQFEAKLAQKDEDISQREQSRREKEEQVSTKVMSMLAGINAVGFDGCTDGGAPRLRRL